MATHFLSLDSECGMLLDLQTDNANHARWSRHCCTIAAVATLCTIGTCLAHNSSSDRSVTAAHVAGAKVRLQVPVQVRQFGNLRRFNDQPQLHALPLNEVPLEALSSASPLLPVPSSSGQGWFIAVALSAVSLFMAGLQSWWTRLQTQDKQDFVHMSMIIPTLERTKFVSETLLPTSHGKYRVRAYRHTLDGLTFTDPIAIISGHPEGSSDVPVRVHDACWTSEVLGSLKCDCAQQLQQALNFIRDHPPGIVLYLHQEGRGIGLANKIAAYRMQEMGLNTVDANRVLGLPDDSREYSAVKDILHDLNVQSVKLMTNNPRKVSELKALGVEVSDRMPCVVEEPGTLAAEYLQTKKQLMGHMLR